MNISKSRGFTLIELVVTIVIIATLSVVAIPKYFSYQRDANLSRADAAFASFKTAVGLFHNKWLVEGEPDSTHSVGYGQGDVYPSEAGFPISVDGAPNPQHPVSGQECVELWHALMDVDLTIRDMNTTGTILPSDTDIVAWYNTSNECTYHYTTGFDLHERMPLMKYAPLTGMIKITDGANNAAAPEPEADSR